MNREEARTALDNGHTLTQTYFTPEEWVRKVGSVYEFEDGCSCDPDEFWLYREDSGFDEGWNLYQ